MPGDQLPHLLPLAASSASNTLVQLLPFIIIIAVFWLLLVRPQRTRQRQMAELQRSLTPGQQVMTSAGMFATVAAVEDDTVVLEIAPGVQSRFNRAAVVQVITPGEEPPAGSAPETGASGSGPSDSQA